MDEETFDPETTLIAPCFLHFAPYLKMYSQYCSNHFAATQALSKYMKQSDIASVITRLLADPRNNNRALDDYLIQPIQRIPRYKLLLEELLRRTEV